MRKVAASFLCVVFCLGFCLQPNKSRVAQGNFTPRPSRNRTGSRVGRRRVALSGTFPTAPPRTDRDRFRINQLSSGLFPSRLEREPVLLRRSALRVPHSSGLSSPLCHFPLCTALPCALVGRHSHEEYWHSVTLGLAPGRPSRVPSLRNVSSTT